MAKVPWYEEKQAGKRVGTGGAKAEFDNRIWQEIPQVPFHLLLHSVRLKLPGAVRLKRKSSLIYAVSGKGFYRLVGTTEGVVWPPGESADYDLARDTFFNHAPGFEPGRVTGPYLRDIYPDAKAESDRRNMEARFAPVRTGFRKY